MVITNFVILIYFVIAISACNVQFESSIIEEGFHRQVVCNVSMKCTQVPSFGAVLLLQEIPSSAYVDLYQLNLLKGHDFLSVWSEQIFDVEKPESESSSGHVYFFFQLQRSSLTTMESKIKFPIHLRYHAPSDEKYRQVILKAPRIFMQKNDFSEFHNKKKTTKLICDSSGIDICEWLEVDPEIKNKLFEMEVPVGEFQLISLVTATTATVAASSCIFLSYIVLTK